MVRVKTCRLTRSPGFTIGDLTEPMGLVTTLILVLMTTAGSAAFWLTAGAFVAWPAPI